MLEIAWINFTLVIFTIYCRAMKIITPVIRSNANQYVSALLGGNIKGWSLVNDQQWEEVIVSSGTATPLNGTIN